jgi:hypothetical protein
MDALVLACEVLAPVLCEVSVADDRSELEDGFGAVQAPAGASDVHAVLDEMATGALDHAGSNRPAAFERGGVVQERLLAGQVGGALVVRGPRRFSPFESRVVSLVVLRAAACAVAARRASERIPLPTSTVVPFVLPCRVTPCRELERTL